MEIIGAKKTLCNSLVLLDFDCAITAKRIDVIMQGRDYQISDCSGLILLLFQKTESVTAARQCNVTFFCWKSLGGFRVSLRREYCRWYLHNCIAILEQWKSYDYLLSYALIAFEMVAEWGRRNLYFGWKEKYYAYLVCLAYAFHSLIRCANGSFEIKIYVFQ